MMFLNNGYSELYCYENENIFVPRTIKKLIIDGQAHNKNDSQLVSLRNVRYNEQNYFTDCFYHLGYITFPGEYQMVHNQIEIYPTFIQYVQNFSIVCMKSRDDFEIEKKSESQFVIKNILNKSFNDEKSVNNFNYTLICGKNDSNIYVNGSLEDFFIKIQEKPFLVFVKDYTVSDITYYYKEAIELLYPKETNGEKYELIFDSNITNGDQQNFSYSYVYMQHSGLTPAESFIQFKNRHAYIKDNSVEYKYIDGALQFNDIINNKAPIGYTIYEEV